MFWLLDLFGRGISFLNANYAVSKIQSIFQKHVQLPTFLFLKKEKNYPVLEYGIIMTDIFTMSLSISY